MEIIVSNLSSKIRRVERDGRKWLIAPLSLIVPGVLNGSQGALYYPPEEVGRNTDDWNGMPLVVYHPISNTGSRSARHPDILEKQGVGYVFEAKFNGKKLVAEGWFDEVKLQKVDNRVYHALLRGEKIELSTGLYTTNVPANDGANHNGKPYAFVAKDYRPDHVAILPDQVGACSLRDGCGVMNHNTDKTIQKELEFVSNFNPNHDKQGRFAKAGYSKGMVRKGKFTLEGAKHFIKRMESKGVSKQKTLAVIKASGLLLKPRDIIHLNMKTKNARSAKARAAAAANNKRHDARSVRTGKFSKKEYQSVGYEHHPVTDGEETTVNTSTQNTCGKDCDCESCKRNRKRLRLKETQNRELEDGIMPLGRRQRARLIRSIVGNCSCGDSAKSVLSDLADDDLIALASKVENLDEGTTENGCGSKHSKKKKKMMEEEEDMEQNAEKKSSEKKTTENNAAPMPTKAEAVKILCGDNVTVEQFDSLIANAKKLTEDHRSMLVTKLTSHIKDDAARKVAVENYSKMPTENLEFIVATIPEAPKAEVNTPAFNFRGAGGASTENQKLDYDPKAILPIPEVQYDTPLLKSK